MEILFVHGAGGWTDDQPMAAELRGLLRVPVAAPQFPDEDMSAAAWGSELDRNLASLGPGAVVVGHSFGASMALLHYADDGGRPVPAGLVLLATPSWGTEGWEGHYALPPSAQIRLPVWLHHCRDDTVVPSGHLNRLAGRIPHAGVRAHVSGGHQFEGRMAYVAHDVATLARQQ